MAAVSSSLSPALIESPLADAARPARGEAADSGAAAHRGAARIGWKRHSMPSCQAGALGRRVAGTPLATAGAGRLEQGAVASRATSSQAQSPCPAAWILRWNRDAHGLRERAHRRRNVRGSRAAESHRAIEASSRCHGRGWSTSASSSTSGSRSGVEALRHAFFGDGPWQKFRYFPEGTKP